MKKELLFLFALAVIVLSGCRYHKKCAAYDEVQIEQEAAEQH